MIFTISQRKRCLTSLCHVVQIKQQGDVPTMEDKSFGTFQVILRTLSKDVFDVFLFFNRKCIFAFLGSGFVHIFGQTPRGRVYLGIRGGDVLPVSPNPDLISDQNCHFLHPFSDLASKIHTRFLT